MEKLKVILASMGQATVTASTTNVLYCHCTSSLVTRCVARTLVHSTFAMDGLRGSVVGARIERNGAETQGAVSTMAVESRAQSQEVYY